MNIKYASDVLGEQVIRILDPNPFLQCKLNNKNIHNEKYILLNIISMLKDQL